MYVRRFVLRIAGLCLLIAAVVNAERTKETTLTCRSIWQTDDANVGCADVDRPFLDVLCEGVFTLNVINACYGFHAVNRNIGKSCSNHEHDCFESVPSNSDRYYAEILAKCNGKTQCDSDLKAKKLHGQTSCDRPNDYVLIQFCCLSPNVSSTLATRSSECTPAAPSTVPVTSVAYDSLPASSTRPTGGATIASDASTYTMVDNLWNVSNVVTDTSSTDNITNIAGDDDDYDDASLGIIVGSVVGIVVLIIALLVLIYIIWRKRKSEDTSTRRGKDSDHGLNGFSPSGDTTLVNTPQDMTHCSIKYDVAPLSIKAGMPTHSLGNHPNTAIYALAQDPPHTRVNSLAQEPSTAASSLAREPSADYYSEVDDAVFRSQAQEPYIALYSLPQEPNAKFYKDIKKSAIYVNVTAPSKAVHSQEQKTNSSAYPEDPVRIAYNSRVEKSEFAKVKIDPEEQQPSYPTRSQSDDRQHDLVLIDNSLYVATETPLQINADELTLRDNSLYEWNSNLQSLSNA